MKETLVVDVSTPGAIEQAAEVIRAGGLVAFPTETVYGLGADACNPTSVARIFEAKRRPSFDPLIVHVADSNSASFYGDLSGEVARRLTEAFWPGPLTLVVSKTSRVPPIVTAGLDTVGLRVPAHPAALALIRAANRGIAAPSANPFGYVSPTNARHVAEQLRGRVDLILDGGDCPVGVESTILALTAARPVILRLGGVPPEQLERVLGPIERFVGNVARPQAPGQLTRHYATHTPLQISKGNELELEIRPGERVGLITLSPPQCRHRFVAVEVLSESGDLREAAANLFAALRRLDSLCLDRLVALPVPEIDLGMAIMDRLRRCAVPWEDDPAMP